MYRNIILRHALSKCWIGAQCRVHRLSNWQTDLRTLVLMAIILLLHGRCKGGLVDDQGLLARYLHLVTSHMLMVLGHLNVILDDSRDFYRDLSSCGHCYWLLHSLLLRLSTVAWLRRLFLLLSVVILLCLVVAIATAAPDAYHSLWLLVFHNLL